MTSYHDLPDIEREILKLLLNSPDYTAPGGYLSNLTYYPDAEVFAALHDMILPHRNLLRNHCSAGRNPVIVYTPSPPMLTHLLELRSQASADLKATAREVLDQIRRFEKGEGHD